MHEACFDLRGGAGWKNRAHFFSAAAEAMRRVLIEIARGKGAVRRGSGAPLPPSRWYRSRSTGGGGDDLVAIDEALERFARHSPAKAELVKLRYFAGLNNRRSADLLGISVATAKRHWLMRERGCSKICGAIHQQPGWRLESFEQMSLCELFCA